MTVQASQNYYFFMCDNSQFQRVLRDNNGLTVRYLDNFRTNVATWTHQILTALKEGDFLGIFHFIAKFQRISSTSYLF